MVGVEPELAADARDSLRAGRRIAWPASRTARTLADALRVEQVGELPFAHMRAYVHDIVTVTEDEIRGAVRRIADELADRGTWRRGRGGRYLYRRADLQGGTYVAVLSGGNTARLRAELLCGYAPPEPRRRMPRDRRNRHERVMRAALAYTSARVLLLVAALGVFYLIGARGLLLLVLAAAVSGLISFVVLSRQRDAMSGALFSRVRELRERLDTGARSEDQD